MRHFLQDPAQSQRRKRPTKSPRDSFDTSQGIELSDMNQIEGRGYGIVRRTDSNNLAIVTPSSRFRTLSFVSGLYLKYLFCKCLTLYRCLVLMFAIDPLIILATTFTLIPILQIDGTKIDVQIVIASLKVTLLCVNVTIIQRMLCKGRYKKNSKRLYGFRSIVLVICLL